MRAVIKLVLEEQVMTKLQRIENDVENLTPEELAAFRKWFQSYDAVLWGQQLERDANSGKLDKLRDEALGDQAAKPTQETKKASFEQFVSFQLQSGRFPSYEALVRHAIEIFQHSEMELDEIAEQLRGPVESLQRGEPGLELDLEKVKRDGRKRLAAASGRCE
jgi:hypothetical protein